jgi:hypothetical protein
MLPQKDPMIYEFKCKATGNLIMTQSVGDQVLDLLGKRSPKGIITVLEMPLVLQTLRHAFEKSQAEQKALRDQNNLNKDTEFENRERPPTISLAQRLVPFIEMIERAHAAEKDVMWGV